MEGRFTQSERLIGIQTPLGPDHLLVRSFTGTETISQPFQFRLDLVSEDPRLNFDQIVGQKVTVSIMLADSKSERYFNGHISRFAQLPTEDRLARYQADMVPWLWLLTRTADCRVFQDMTVPDIVYQVFHEFGFMDFEPQLQRKHDPWEYCVQYRETACAFVMRLMEQEGIFFYFRHEPDKHVMVIGDSPAAHGPCPDAATVRHEYVLGPGYAREEDAVLRWRYQQELCPGKYALRDYNFETPAMDLLTKVDSHINQGGNQRYEVFDYPGKYEKREQGEAQIKLRIEEQELPHEVIHGDGDCRAFSAGFRFELTNHEREDQNRKYVLTSVTHRAQSGSFYSEEGKRAASYSNSFVCIPFSVPFRPPRRTAKRLVEGPQTAMVVGPPGEEIYTDEYGRVKVQFPWDRRGQQNQRSSCWIRVSQPWAGKNWGGISIPRIGQEVIVDFLEGDPDRPIITGRVYNADQTVPYPLPKSQTISTMKSHSSKGGGGFNEIRLEDGKGKEQVFLHAERDMDVRVKHDRRETIASNSHLIVGGDLLGRVSGDQHLHVKGDRNEEVEGTVSLQAGTDMQEKVGMKYGLDSGTEIHLKAGMNVVIESGVTLTLKSSGGFININPAGVFISGTVVMLNSGGTAGSGAGSSPQPPKAPQEADRSQPGGKAKVSPKPAKHGPAATVLKQAAQSGAPFCEICQRK